VTETRSFVWRDPLTRQAEALHEREWRVPNEFRFDWHDVRFLIVPDSSWQRFYAEWIEDWAGEEYARVGGDPRRRHELRGPSGPR
jgi:hypothetical protein